ncbi:MAG: YHS domain-containing protein [Planctomycetes bacterium]|nr:YHS domain-containing protein [Planctomycetota bacterium]
MVTDPVCGMRLGRSDAAATEEYRGHPYYFCSSVCRERFADDPLRFITVQLD